MSVRARILLTSSENSDCPDSDITVMVDWAVKPVTYLQKMEIAMIQLSWLTGH